MVPGWSGSEPDHWQARWAEKLSTARMIEQIDWIKPDRTAWVDTLIAHIANATKPVVLVAHSLGVVTVAHAAATMSAQNTIAGAYLVALADADHADQWPITRGETFPHVEAGFHPIPTDRLPFTSVVVASRNDPYCSYSRATELAEAWGSEVSDAGDAGHINVASGHGPWPEGLLRFAGFLKTL